MLIDLITYPGFGAPSVSLMVLFILDYDQLLLLFNEIIE